MLPCKRNLELDSVFYTLVSGATWDALRYIEHVHEAVRYGTGPVGGLHPSGVAEGSQAEYLTVPE